jgi:TPR repeat protein
MHAFAYETPKDPVRATAAAKRSCELEDPLGCNSVGYHYEIGEGVPADPAQATRFYKRSCDLGMQASCKKLK